MMADSDSEEVVQQPVLLTTHEFGAGDHEKIEGAEAEPQQQQQQIKILDYAPNESSIDISIDQNGLLYKEIQKEGTGECPGKHTKVFIHYIGHLADGLEFGKNMKPNKPLVFELGKAIAIKGLELGISTMKKGEEARLIIHHSLGYGETGVWIMDGRIPSRATLFMDVTLVEWKEEDISPLKNDGISRKILVEGELRYPKPNDGAVVEVELEGSFEGRIFDQRQIQFDLGEGSEVNICKGLEIALKKFAKGDTALITIKSEYGFGSSPGNQKFGIPQDATIVYKVRLVDFTNLPEPWNLNGNEKLDYGKRFKEKGTKYFKEEKYNLAVSQYERIVKYLKSEDSLKDEDEETRKTLLVASYLNQSICWQKLSDYIKARETAESALELESNNPKAYFRKGLACYMLKAYNVAFNDFHKVLEFEPDNKAAQAHLHSTKLKQHEQLEEVRRQYSKMFK